MGRKLVLTGSKLSDLATPKLANIDPIESAGSLLLMESGHPLIGARPALVNNATMPNLFHTNLAAQAGVPDTGLDISYLTVGSLAGRVENGYTAKGGIYGIVSNGTPAADAFVAGEVGSRLRASTAFLNYMNVLRLASHKLYVSHWMVPTRRMVDTGAVYQQFGTSGDTAIYGSFKLIGNNGGTQWRGANPAFLQTTTPMAAVGVPLRGSVEMALNLVAQAGVPGTFGPQWGRPAMSYWAPTFAPKLPSFVHYRSYVEDMTVSGRTFAQLEALDSQLFAAAFGAGGRYAADTYPSVSTLP